MKRFLSTVLSVIMCLTLLAPLSETVSADWEDNKFCVCCEEWTDDFCEDCATDRFCVCSSCHDRMHCGECGGCYLNQDVEPCNDKCFSAFCKDCAKDLGLHCVDCGKCFQGDEADCLCQDCGRCSECIDGFLCGECHYCTECVFHCPECFACDAEPCVSGADDHCANECELCENCGECMLALDLDTCEYCGLCEECCADNACPECGMCVEDPDYEEHRCPECEACFTYTDRCDTCGLCEECCLKEAAALGCDCGELCYEEVTDEHICQDCGLCFGVTDRCETCAGVGEYRCTNCCEEISRFSGCDCADPVCVNDPAWEEHFNTVHGGINDTAHSAAPRNTWSMDENYHWIACRYCDDAAHITGKGAHTMGADGTCTVCGYSTGGIIITKQPKNKVAKAVDVTAGDSKVLFNVTARSDRELSYQWQRANSAAFTSFVYDLDEDWGPGYDTDSFWCLVGEDFCYGLYGANDNQLYLRCEITDGEHTVYSDVVTLTVNHVFDSNQIISSEDGHQIRCRNCDNYSDVQQHAFKEWVWNEDRTEKTATCAICGYQKTVPAHTHAYDFSIPTEDDYACTNQDTDEWTAQVDGETFIIDRYHHEATCADPDCDYVISELHDWGRWTHSSETPVEEGYIGGIYRECQVCGYQDSRARKDSDGNDILWQLGTHPINVTGGRIYEQYGLIREGQSVTLIPDKVEDKVFNGWTVGRYVLNTSTKQYEYSGQTVTLSSRKAVKAAYGLSTDLLTLTIPEMNDAGAWDLTAVYTDGCDHAQTELSGAQAATCGAYGYTGDTVCATCGKILEKGTEIAKTPHQNTHVVTEDIYLTNSRGEVQYKKNGDPIYVARAYTKGDCCAGIPGYSGDVICDDCGHVAEKGKSLGLVHNWVIMDGNVLVEPTTATKGKGIFHCDDCGMEKEMPIDYTGPDYSVLPRSLSFTFAYGDPIEPFVVDFKRVGRNADQIEKIVECNVMNDILIEAEITGDMQITVKPVFSMAGYCDNSIYTDTLEVKFQLKDGSFVWLDTIVSGADPDIEDPYMPVSIRYLKSKETYDLTILNSDDSEPHAYHAGEAVEIKAPASDFIEWEVISDKSGYISDLLNNQLDPQRTSFTLTMPKNDVVIRANIVHEHEYEFTKTIAPTCTKKGYDLYTCKYCDEKEKRNYVAALGHKTKATIARRATMTKAGVIKYICKTCGKVVSKKAIPVNTFSVKGNTVTAKYGQKTSIKRAKALTIKAAKGTLSFKKTSGNAKIIVGASSGNVVVKKGLKKGTYKIKVRVRAAGNAKYAAAAKTVVVKIVVK